MVFPIFSALDYICLFLVVVVHVVHTLKSCFNLLSIVEQQIYFKKKCFFHILTFWTNTYHLCHSIFLKNFHNYSTLIYLFTLLRTLVNDYCKPGNFCAVLCSISTYKILFLAVLNVRLVSDKQNINKNKC